jgi:hypothetical protein
MTKEELAEQSADELISQFDEIDSMSIWDVANKGFLAGYEAAEKKHKEELLRIADMAFCAGRSNTSWEHFKIDNGLPPKPEK